jgi:hypothetical protein
MVCHWMPCLSMRRPRFMTQANSTVPVRSARCSGHSARLASEDPQCPACDDGGNRGPQRNVHGLPFGNRQFDRAPAWLGECPWCGCLRRPDPAFAPRSRRWRPAALHCCNVGGCLRKSKHCSSSAGTYRPQRGGTTVAAASALALTWRPTRDLSACSTCPRSSCTYSAIKLTPTIKATHHSKRFAACGPSQRLCTAIQAFMAAPGAMRQCPHTAGGRLSVQGGAVCRTCPRQRGARRLPQPCPTHLSDQRAAKLRRRPTAWPRTAA